MVVLARSRRDGVDIAGLSSGSALANTDLSEGLELVSLPAFVPVRERAAITVCMHAVASGEFSGLEFAELLQRAELRCEVAFDVSRLQLSCAAAADVYVSTVVRLDGSLGWATEFVDDVAGLAVLMGIGSRGSGFCRVDELDSTTRSALSLKVIGENVVVASPAAGPGLSSESSSTMHDDHLVVPFSVYRALMKVSVKVIGSSVFVGVSRSIDGIYRLSERFDCSECYSTSSLPLGRYALPGGKGKLVSSRYMSGALENVLALPKLRATRGFCYIGMLPPSVRLRAASVLGREPSVVNLADFFPEVYDWTDREAQLSVTGAVGGELIYHVDKCGTLPVGLSSLSRIGAPERSNDRYASELSAYTDKLLSGIFDVRQDKPDVVQIAPVKPVHTSNFPTPAMNLERPAARRVESASSGVSSRGFGSSSGGLVPIGAGISRHNRSASDSGLMVANRVVLDMGASAAFRPVWQDVDEPRMRTWVTRLGEGGPISPRELMDLTKVKVSADLPSPPPSMFGVSVLVRPDSGLRSEGGRMVTWDKRSVAISGCNIECAKVSSSKGKRFLAAHPMRGVLCRYDISFDKSVVVNGSLNVSPIETVLWMHSDASFHVVGSGTIVRTWFDDGMPGLGAMVTSMVFSFNATAMRMYEGEIHAERVIGLELKSVDVNAGLVRFHKRFKMRPSVEKVHLYAFDEVVAEPVLLVINARGLRYVVVHGVRVPADSCQVSVVVLDAQTTVKICLDASGDVAMVDAQMVFVRESKRYSACVGHNVAGTVQSGITKKPLFIEN